MRRSGYLLHDYLDGYFGGGYFGALYRQTLTTEQQKSKINARYQKLKEINATVGIRQITSSTDRALFAPIKGEDINARLRRLEASGLYTPGSIMTKEYANLVNYATTDQMTIDKINQQRAAWQDAQNLQRYGTKDISKIVQMAQNTTVNGLSGLVSSFGNYTGLGQIDPTYAIGGVVVLFIGIVGYAMWSSAKREEAILAGLSPQERAQYLMKKQEEQDRITEARLKQETQRELIGGISSLLGGKAKKKKASKRRASKSRR